MKIFIHLGLALAAVFITLSTMRFCQSQPSTETGMTIYHGGVAR
jgi:hypothetical protein